MLWIGLLPVLSLDAALGVVVVASALSVALDALFGTDDDGRAYSRHSAARGRS
jgi:hypothetical protein